MKCSITIPKIFVIIMPANHSSNIVKSLMFNVKFNVSKFFWTLGFSNLRIKKDGQWSSSDVSESPQPFYPDVTILEFPRSPDHTQKKSAGCKFTPETSLKSQMTWPYTKPPTLLIL